ncbi:MAG: methylaspartate ammonia-lyase [Turicibacter sp.]|nr:methylaspartate ammonia-lyase [Turicibacter sp.]
MKIKDIVCSAGKTGFFFDDQKAIKSGAKMDGNVYIGKPMTEGFKAVRQAGESISVIFILEDGEIAYGDCAAVQYSGAGGRDPLFLASDFIPIIEREIKPLFVGKEIGTFKEMSKIVDDMSIGEKRLHTAIRYGITQALLDTVAKAHRKIPAQIIAAEYGTTISNTPIPIFSQSGDERYSGADAMILKAAAVLPHALINNVETKLGANGEKLAEYVAWLSKRIRDVSHEPSYNPVLHIDVYGTFGIAFDNDMERITDYIGSLEGAAKPFHLRIEGPIDTGEREGTMLALRNIRQKLEQKGIDVEIVADEWCNTYEDIVYFTDNKAGHMAQIKTPDLGGINNSIEAVLYCKANNMGAYLGGTCNETERSGQICAHIAMATSPAQVLAKPGMGVNEGFMIVYNEMQRILALKGVL